jgi:hypothetical protein
MKKNILFSVALLGIVILSCNKTTTLPVSPAPAKNFTILKFAHVKDTLAVGDPLSFTVSGLLADTTKTISAVYTVTNGSTVTTVGTAASPIKINRVILGPSGTGTYTFSATVTILSTAGMAKNSKLTIASTFSYQLSLSSAQPSVVTFTDQGLRPGDKTNLTTVLVQ